MPSPPIPDPRIARLNNQTPYPVMNCQKMGRGRQFYDVIVAKGAFRLRPGQLTPLQHMPEPIIADQHEPVGHDVLALCKAGDLVMHKPGTDVLVSGSARQPVAQSSWLASLRLYPRGRDTPVINHELRLYGTRHWYFNKEDQCWRITPAETVDYVPLGHAHAFGGTYQDNQGNRHMALNPAGRGVAVNMQENACTSAHQIELAGYPLDQLAPGIPVLDYPLCSMAAVARTWPERIALAGTYDERWWQGQAQAALKDFPDDFNERFYQCANPRLVAQPCLRGDELLELTGLLRNAPRLRCYLPGIRLVARFNAQTPTSMPRVSFALDTLHIDLDAQILFVTWRLRIPSHGPRLWVVIEQKSLKP